MYKQKGTYGYLESKQRIDMIMTLVCAALVVILVTAGILIYKKRLNILMVPGMMCVIPTANYLVNYLATVKYHTAPKVQYEAIRAFDDAGMLLSDMVIVDEKGGRNGLDFAVIYKGGIVGYQSSKEDTKDMVELTINGNLSRKSVPMRIKVYRNWEDFMSRVRQLEEPAGEEEKHRITLAMEAVLQSVM